jgi:hypothetical protein
MGLAAAGPSSTTQFTSVGQILNNPGGFIGQEVQLQGRATEQIDNVRFLFTDGTGEIRIQFEPAGPFPPLDVGIQVVGTAASGTGGIAVKIDVSSFETLPAFSRDDVLEVRGRFTDPGYRFGDVVGYYLAFKGVPPGEKYTRVVQYRAPTVSGSLQITGHVALVSGDFKPVAIYRLTVKP